MTFVVLVAPALFAGAFTGCASSGTDQARPWHMVQIHRGTDAGPKEAVVLRPLEITICLSDAAGGAVPAQESTALEQLRKQAAEKGADAVVKVSCHSSRSDAPGCVLPMTCGGDAVRFTKAASSSS